VSDQHAPAGSTDPRIDAALREYLERIDRGESVDREEFISRHAEITDALRSFFAAEEPFLKMGGARGDDPSLRQRVERLLAAHPQVGDLLEPPAREEVGAAGAPTLPPREKSPVDPARAETVPYDRPVEGVGAVIVGRYKLLETLGQGGMGVVFMAQQTQPVKRLVALKLIKLGMDSRQILARFEAERQALALMDHPNIAKVLDAGTTDSGRPFFVMELVKGVPITEYCDATRLSVPDRLSLFMKVCSAVQHAHQKGIIHRDLKPSNILVAPYDDKPVPKVIDFGLAKAMHQSLTERTLHTARETVLGTPLYMSPEQAQLNNLDVDTRSDIYSLGVLLYELLTGTTPLEKKRFKDAAWDEIKRIIREEDPPRPSMRLSSTNTLPSLAAIRQTEPARLTKLVRGELDWIVMKALEKNRVRRYETANGFAMDIQRYLADEPVSAGPPGAGYRLRKLVRRNKGPVIAAAAVAIALVAGVAAVVVVQARANRVLEAKNEELDAKNTELADEQAKVQARFEMAQKAIAMFHTGVSEDMLLKNDQFKELRTKLLKEAAGFYADLEKLLAGETDAKSRRLLAAGYSQLGELTEKIGSQPEALVVHRKALALRRELAAAAGADVETRLDVARSLRMAGMLLDATGDKAGALAAWEEQRELSERLAEEAPSDAVRAVLAASYNSIGYGLSQTAGPAEGLASHEKALSIRQKLADANPSVTDFQRDLAMSHHNVGTELWMTGKPAEALASYEKALAIRQKLADTNPSVTQFQLDLALSHNDICWCLSQTGKPAEALASVEKSLAIQQKLADANPAVTQFQRELAHSQVAVGVELMETGKPAEALASYEKSRAIRQKLADANPSVAQFQSELAGSQRIIGMLLSQTGKAAEGLSWKERALAIFQKLADGNPTIVEYLSAQAETQNDIGLDLAQMGKPAEALASYEKSLAIRQKLADANPSVTLIQSDLAQSYLNIGGQLALSGKNNEAIEFYTREEAIRQKLATAKSPRPDDTNALANCQTNTANLLRKAGRRVEARAACERALALREPLVKEYPQVTYYRGGLVETYLRTGQVQYDAKDLAAAAASWKRAIALYEGLKLPSGDETFLKACLHASLSELANRQGSGVSADKGRVEADRAMSWLRKAVTAGYGNPDSYRTESALDPLRGREDFKQLVTELETKAKARTK
jgi:tetratricopeptide (TPR) repeat protein